MGLVVTDLITSPVVSWRGWETHPPAPRLSCHSLHDLERRSVGREVGPSNLFLGKYRKNAFWLKQNTICSDRILTFGIRSRFKLRRDGDQCGDLRAVLQDQEPWRLVDEDTDQHSHPLFRMSPGKKMLGARGRDGIKRY